MFLFLSNKHWEQQGLLFNWSAKGTTEGKDAAEMSAARIKWLGSPPQRAMEACAPLVSEQASRRTQEGSSMSARTFWHDERRVDAARNQHVLQTGRKTADACNS